MPGTIQVTVLEFKGVSPSSMPSAKSLKVSMGKRQYQTWDKGDFSFPITKLGENLVVALLDAGGNEIAHQDIQTMQIIEKGSWDEVFSISGCGHVHMKLQFILSEEDRNRIRVMRESAMKKKLEMNPNIKLGSSEAVSSTSDSVETSIKDEQKVSDSQKGFVEIDVVSPEVEASQAGSSFASATCSALSESSRPNERRNILASAIPNATDGSKSAPSSPGRHEIKIGSSQLQERVPDEKIETQPVANIGSDIKEGPSRSLTGSSSISGKKNSVASKFQDDYPIRVSWSQGPMEKTPSNVRKMISAFENSRLQNMAHMDYKQEVKSLKKAASLPSQLNRFRKEGLLEDPESKTVVPPAGKTLTDFKDYFVGNLPQTPTTVSARAGNVPTDSKPSQVPKELASIISAIPSEGNDSNAEDTFRALSSEPTLKELKNSPVDVMRQCTSETATSSGRMPEEQSQVTRPQKLSTKPLNSSESSVAEGSGRGRRSGLKSSTMIMASDPKPKTLEYYEEEYYPAQSSGMWIFPDNTRRLCITTAGKQVAKIVGHHHNEAKTHQVKKVSSEPKVLEKNLMHETEDKTEKNKKKIADQPESRSDSSSDDSSSGLVGQVVKIAVIVGFGVLVLLTRQREPRKKHKEENDHNLFDRPDYVDERTLRPWTGKQ